MPLAMRSSGSAVISVTVLEICGGASAIRPPARRTGDAVISSVFQASQEGHCPCHCDVRSPQAAHT